MLVLENKLRVYVCVLQNALDRTSKPRVLENMIGPRRACSREHTQGEGLDSVLENTRYACSREQAKSQCVKGILENTIYRSVFQRTEGD